MIGARLALRHAARVSSVRRRGEPRRFYAACWCGWTCTSTDRAHARAMAVMHSNLGDLGDTTTTAKERG